MESTTSSSSGSRSRSSGSSALLPVKPEPEETSSGRRTRSFGIVINEPDASSSCLVRAKTEPGLVPVKQEHPAMAAAADEAALKWARDDYVRVLEEISACRRDHEEGGVVILDESDEEARTPVCLDDPGQGSSKDGALAGGNNDYIAFYKLIGM
ncbi:hypothetical protein D1007_56129 [Hordeum vulgare]|nr:hypothetical protein D1007_56129 [Hordeum vulgare]